MQRPPLAIQEPGRQAQAAALAAYAAARLHLHAPTPVARLPSSYCTSLMYALGHGRSTVTRRTGTTGGTRANAPGTGDALHLLNLGTATVGS